MGAILITLFTFVLILVSLFLMLVVLMQRASANAGLGAAFGGGMAESTFGAETGNILTKATIYAAAGFFVLCFGLYLGYLSRFSAQLEEEPGQGLPELAGDVNPAAAQVPDLSDEAEATGPTALTPADRPRTQQEMGLGGGVDFAADAIPVSELDLPQEVLDQLPPGARFEDGLIIADDETRVIMDPEEDLPPDILELILQRASVVQQQRAEDEAEGTDEAPTEEEAAEPAPAPAP